MCVGRRIAAVSRAFVACAMVRACIASIAFAAVTAGNSVGSCQQPAADSSLRLMVPPANTLPAPGPERVPPGKSRGGLTLPALEQMALGSNPSIARASSLAAAARGNWVQVGLSPNPSVGYEGQQLGSGGQAEQHGVVVSQEVIGRGKLRLNRAVAAQEVARAEQELAAQQQRVLTDVRIAFYRALLAQRQIDLTLELVRMGQQGLQATEATLRQGVGTRSDLLQARLELENAQILAENARNRHLAAWHSLSAVVGQPGLCPQALEGDAYAPPRILCWSEIIHRLLAASPEIATAAANVERARFALQRARVEPRPNLNFEGLVNWQDNGIGGKPDAAVKVSLPLPLWDKNQGAVLRAEHELAAASAALAQLELDLQNRLAPVYERYANAASQVQRYRTTILPVAQQSLDVTQQLYTAGVDKGNYLNLLLAQRTFSQTNLSYLDALRELRTAEAEIDGLLLSGSLQSR